MRSDCRICHSDQFDLRLKLAPTPIGDQFLIEPRPQPLHPIDLYQCRQCGLAQLLYEITPEEIYRDYLYLTSSSPGLREHFNAYAKDVAVNLDLHPGDLVMDIGSNDGMLLAEFQKLGMQVIGIEANEQIAQVARGAGIPTACTYFKRGLGLGKAKLITANNVVANMNDLDTFMEVLLENLAEDGTFVFESFYLGDVIRNMVFDFIYHEHLSAFSVKPVKALMRRYGMQLYRVDHLPTKGGSIRYYCNRYYVGRNQTEVPDDEAELYSVQTWLEFAERIEAQKAKTVDLLNQLRADGKRLAGFGASISATTLSYHFGINEYIDYLLDDNPAKIRRYSPGSHKLVQACADLETLRPDYVIALAWRFAEDFHRKHPHVNLVVPLPEFRFIPAS